MSLRNNRTLKLISILLFTIGLVAPILGSAGIIEPVADPVHSTLLQTSAHQHLLDQFLFEENTGEEEEREAKDHKTHVLFVVDFSAETGCFNSLFAAKSDGYNSCPVQKLGTHPPLFRLYRAIII